MIEYEVPNEHCIETKIIATLVIQMRADSAEEATAQAREKVAAIKPRLKSFGADFEFWLSDIEILDSPA